MLIFASVVGGFSSAKLKASLLGVCENIWFWFLINFNGGADD